MGKFLCDCRIVCGPVKPGQEQAGHAFGTPTIVHFGSVLLLSAILSAPWHAIRPAATLLAMLGFVGSLYELVVAWRMREQTVYKPVLEDWSFHVLLPFAAYASLAASGFAARSHSYNAMFVVAAAALLLLFVGVHNAWDTVTYHVFSRRE